MMKFWDPETDNSQIVVSQIDCLPNGFNFFCEEITMEISAGVGECNCVIG